MKSSNVFALIMTGFLLALIIFASPTYGINLSVYNLYGIHTKGNMINFIVKADVENGEHIPVNYLNISFKMPDNSIKNCQIMLNGSVYECEFVYVNSVQATNLSYGYGYGYGNSYYLGYGYGYSGQGSILFDFVLDTSKIQEGNYNANIILHTGISPNEKSFSTTESFSVVRSAKSFSSGGFIKQSLFVDVNVNLNKINLRIINDGTEDFDRVYVYIPQDNYTSEPFSLKAKEEAFIEYITEKQGNYILDVYIIGETKNVIITRQKSVEINFIQNESKSTESSENLYEEQKQLEQKKQPITGLVVLEQLVKYWYVGAILVVGGLMLGLKNLILRKFS
ncbi:MAG: hypothetical protein QXM68_04290 [Candidatus Aenigmatarchaeota archaeon]|nr:hypothetical protein [Candidatus Aenigmarchaeota archaeon]